MNMLKTIILWVLAAIFTANSLLITFKTNFNTGHILMWLSSLAFITYALFHKLIDPLMKKGFLRIVNAVIVTGILVYAALFIFVAVSGYFGQAKGDEKAIIVLGAGLRGERVGDVLRRRLVAALDEWNENPAAVLVVTGGQGPGETITEAEAMTRWLTARGVPEDKIILEDKSTSTEENLKFSIKLLEDSGISISEPVAVVSNAFHCYRASCYAEKLGYVDVRTVPASMNITTLLPSYMREVLAILFMWVFKRTLD